MKRWSYCTNSLRRECIIYCDEEPWWVEPLADVVSWLCEHTPRIPLPFMKWFKHVDEGGETCTLAEWYGGDLRYVFCQFVHIPLNNWAYNKVHHIYHVNIGWDKGKELFYHDDPQRWDEEEADHD